MQPLFFRSYGSGDKKVILLHGGPAAPGGMGKIGKKLARLTEYQFLEPYQRGSSDVPLTVAQHVKDLHDFITENCPAPPVLMGHSWGAMLALAYAAEHSNTISAILLVGGGTFSLAARGRMKEIIASRMNEDFRNRLAEIEDKFEDKDKALAAKGSIYEEIYTYEKADAEDGDEVSEDVTCDKKAHEETWNDMVRQQELGVYPSAFSNITVPTIMMHGSHDPHPGAMIRDTLLEFIPHLQYVEFARCGHTPWEEKAAKDLFYGEVETILNQVSENLSK